MSQTEVQLIKNNAVVEADIANDAVTRDKINVVSTSSAPGIEIKGDNGSQEGYLQLNCRVNSHGVKIQSPPHSASQSYKIILPDNQIAVDKILKVKSITGSGSTATGQLEFADPGASDFVKLQAATGSDLGGFLIFDNLDTATYRAFKLYFALLPDSSADGMYPYFRFRTGGASGADDSASHYSYTYSYGAQVDGTNTIARINENRGGLSHTVGGQATVEGMSGVLDIMLCRSGDGFNTGGGGSRASGSISQHNEVENWRGGYANIQYNNSSAVNHTGFKLWMGSGGNPYGGFDNYKYALYGVKG